jgi:hypothetical protein
LPAPGTGLCDLCGSAVKSLRCGPRTSSQFSNQLAFAALMSSIHDGISMGVVA